MADSKQGRRRRGWLFPMIAAVVVGADQFTKSWVRGNMSLEILGGDSIPVLGPFQLTYAQNTGSAFSLFTGQTLALSLLGVTSLVLILVFYRALSPVSTVALIALSLVFGGAVGNLIDRGLFGEVTDFLDVRLWGNFHWPYFNVADSAITVGGFTLVGYMVARLKRQDGRVSGRQLRPD